MEPSIGGRYVTYADHVAAVAEAERRGIKEGKNLTVNWAQAYADGYADGEEQGQRDAIAAGGGIHGTDCTFLSGGSCNCHPETSPDGEASTPHATAPIGSETSVAPAGEDYGAPARIDTVEYGNMRYEQGVRDERAALDACQSVDDAVQLLQTIGLDITYTDEGLRVIARQIVGYGQRDEREKWIAECELIAKTDDGSATVKRAMEYLLDVLAIIDGSGNGR
jgi:hypothetical protein